MKYLSKLVAVIILVYGLSYLHFFWQTPLGKTPVLDGTENFLLAKEIANDNFPKEPFFRSMLYPALLSIPYSLGFDTNEELFRIASLSGMIFHFVATIFVFLLAKNLWQNEKSAIFASLIYGLYPPAIFFAGEPLDTTISISFMLASIYTFLSASDHQDNIKLYSASGILLGIACLLRSNLLPIAIIYLVYPIFNKSKISSDPISQGSKLKVYFSIYKHAVISLICFSFMIVLGGIAGYLHSGEFRLLPWQGPLSFYPANSQRANGKYYKHSVYIPNRQIGVNPARLEAEYIYSIETGQKPPFDLNDFNKFWVRKSIAEIKSNPGNWLKLILKKVYYLYNNYEQYNNKTFSFHKQITPLLRYNPICFGLLIILTFIVIFNYDFGTNKNKVFTLAIGIDALSLGIIAFYVSSRFRLPITPLLVVLGSGIFTFKYSEILKQRNLVLLLVTCFISFSNFFNVADKSTWKEDRLLNAFACSRLELDEEQVLWADRVLKDDPNNLQALRLKIVGFTNLVLEGKISNSKDWARVKKELKYITKKDIYFNDTLLLTGCYIWKFEKNNEKAYELLVNGGSDSLTPELYQALLIYAGLTEPSQSDKRMAPIIPILAAALEARGIETKYKNKNEVERSKKALKFLLD